jgi:hypothetical protein
MDQNPFPIAPAFLLSCRAVALRRRMPFLAAASLHSILRPFQYILCDPCSFAAIMQPSFRKLLKFACFECFAVKKSHPSHSPSGGLGFYPCPSCFIRGQIPDPDHSQVEDRLIVLGKSHQQKLLVVVHTERGDSIRIISARRASRRERKSYEESN